MDRIIHGNYAIEINGADEFYAFMDLCARENIVWINGEECSRHCSIKPHKHMYLGMTRGRLGDRRLGIHLSRYSVGKNPILTLSDVCGEIERVSPLDLSLIFT